MWLLEALVFLTAIAAAYAAILSIRARHRREPVPVPTAVDDGAGPAARRLSRCLGFLIPLVAIAIGFDAINGEFNRRTLSRILAQPIYRDALLLGKFLAGLVALAIGLFSLWLLTIGLGLLLLGLPPNTEEMFACWAFSSRRSPMAASGWRWPSVFGGVPRAGDGGARRARRMAAVLIVLVGRDAARRDPDRRSAARDLRPEPRLSADRADSRPDFAEHALRRNRPGVVAAGDPRARPGALQPGPGARCSARPCRRRRALSWSGRS